MTTQVGEFVIFGAIEDKWKSLGGLGGGLGQPTNNETPTFDGVGRSQGFQGGAIISWHPETGAHLVYGAIVERWLQIGREGFGYPITDETGCPDGIGRFNHFKAVQLAGKPEASIYWSPLTGAHEIYGAIRQKWSSIGWETSPLHYPKDAEHDQSGGGRIQGFQGGLMSWTPSGGAVVHAEHWPNPFIKIQSLADQNGNFIQVSGSSFTPGRSATVTSTVTAPNQDGSETNEFPGGSAATDKFGAFELRLNVNLINISSVVVNAKDDASQNLSNQAML